MKNSSGAKEGSSKEAFLIESLKVVIDGIARTFGPRCEVVLHDLRNIKNLDHSIVKIANGHVTGRTVGGPITNHGLQDFKHGFEKELINYPSITKDGRPIKSSTIILKNAEGKTIASISINFDVTDILNFNAVMQDIFGTSEEESKQGPIETFEGDMLSTLNGIANKVTQKAGKSISSMGKRDRIEIVKQLEDRGFFQIKGATKFIAQKLNVSKFTIYNYLEQVRLKRNSQF